MLDKIIPWHSDRAEECKQLFNDLHDNKLLSLNELILRFRQAIGLNKSLITDKVIENGFEFARS